MPAAGQEAAPRFHALVFSKTTGFRHTDAINQGVPAFRQMTEEHDFSVEHTEDAAVFTDADLARFDVLVMFQTSQGPTTPTCGTRPSGRRSSATSKRAAASSPSTTPRT